MVSIRCGLCGIEGIHACLGKPLVVDLTLVQSLTSKIKDRNSEISELREVMTKVREDLLMRAEVDLEGYKVVDLGSSLWRRLNELLED